MIELNRDGQIIRYKPAELTKGKTDWYIHYSTPDPLRDPHRLYRKRIKLNHIKNQKERIKYAHFLIDQINQKLRLGWNPWLEEQAPKGNTKLIKAIDIFLSRKEKEGLRSDSIRSYASKAKLFTEWLERNGKGEMFTAAFTHYHAREYMEHLLDLGKGSSTYNNTITFGRLLFNWLKDRQYCVEQPFLRIKPLKKQPKKRKIIPPEWRERIRENLEKHHPDFLRSCMLQFYAQIRPAEQARLKLANVDLINKVIHVPDSAAKTGSFRYATIPEALMPYLKEIDSDLPNSFYLVGKDFRPGKVPFTDTRMWTRTWRRMGKKINLPNEYQFYSLRDSGIVYLLEQGVPINQVMLQAGHTSLEMTSKYVKHINKNRDPFLENLRNGF